jgi:hypothetical protein
MDKRYQVFVSSTYADLKEERQRVIQTLMEMDCIPAGMELFPATDEEQFNFIKRIIDDCDYYILIVGGRYGSLTPQGISYTEQEFDYAIAKGLKVIAFLHGDPQSIMVGKTDNNAELSARLGVFRDKAQTGRLVKYWQKADELPGLVSLSLLKTIKTYPAIGWVRASSAGSTELLNEINTLRKENETLRSKLAPESLSSRLNIQDVAGLNDELEITGTHLASLGNGIIKRVRWEYKITWGRLFGLIAPRILSEPPDTTVENAILVVVLHEAGKSLVDAQFSNNLFDTIKIQLQVLGLVLVKKFNTVNGGQSMFWELTADGTAEMFRQRAVRAPASNIMPLPHHGHEGA